jgi:hypothetical protein
MTPDRMPPSHSPHHLPVSRRQLLATLGSGFGLLGLAGALQGAGKLNVPAGAGNTAASNGLHFPAKAKRVIFLCMNGGPSHVDTFDPKPVLRKYAGKQPSDTLFLKNKGNGFLPSPFHFFRKGENGVPVSELLPGIGSCIDDICVLRSMHTDVPNHEPGLLMMHSGHLQPVRPSFGSWLLYGLGNENANLPGYVVLRPGPQIVVGPRLWSQGFLPAKFQGTSVLTTDMAVDKLIGNIKNPHVSPSDQREQLALLHALNRKHQKQRQNDQQLDAEIQAMELAFGMQTQAAEAFDISREPARVREAYGKTDFSNSCLLARRLVERGVRCVQVYYVRDHSWAPFQPWDAHRDNDNMHRELCADADRATAALLSDLKLRGLLDDTLVVWGGEFGRTPYSELSEKKKKGYGPGRDHHHSGFSMFLAGGGVRGGIGYGETDELGMNAVENPVHVHDLHATMLHLMGIDHEKLTYHYSGRDFRLTDVHGHVLHDIIA